MKQNVYKKIAISRKRITRACPDCTDESGIYVFTRTDEEGFKYAYIGQAKKTLSRLASHLMGYVQHIDLSLRKHGLISKNNPYGWAVEWTATPETELDEKEKELIKQYAMDGYQLLNRTSGSQGSDKRDIADTPRKGYVAGWHKGYEKARAEVAHWFNLHLTYDVRKQGNKIQEKAKQKFEEFIGGDDE